jgi:hypothetical protein
MYFKSTSQTPSTNCTIRRRDVSQISLLLTPQFNITSRYSATTLFECSHGIPPSIRDCLILQVSLDSNIHLCETYLQYCGSTTTVCSSVSEWFLLSLRQDIHHCSFTDYVPGLSIKSNNYILPYSLQILTLLLLLDDNL